VSLHLPDLAAAILAGGRASRYGGAPKGMLVLPDGRTIVERTIAETRAAGLEQVALIANDPGPYVDLGVPIIPDQRPGSGPLGGIEAALAHFAARRGVLVLPCDLPGIGRAEIAALLSGFGAAGRSGAPVVAQGPDGFWHPLCAVVPSALLPAVRRAIDEGRLGVHRLWRALEAVPVRFERDTPFFNVNEPEDLERWLLAEALPSGRRAHSQPA